MTATLGHGVLTADFPSWKQQVNNYASPFASADHQLTGSLLLPATHNTLKTDLCSSRNMSLRPFRMYLRNKALSRVYSRDGISWNTRL